MPAVKAIPRVEDKLAQINQTLLKVTASPEKFLLPQPQVCKDIELMLLEIYRTAIESDPDNIDNEQIMPELVIEDMDIEQIWQQLELRNNAVLNDMISKTANLLSLRETKFEVHLKEDEEDEQNEKMFNEGDDSDVNESHNLGKDDDTDSDVYEYGDDDGDEEEDFYEENATRLQKPKRTSIVDDEFFKLDEMEAFLEAEEAKDERKQKGKLKDEDEDGINYFAEDLGDETDDDSDGDNSNPTYKDFFDVKNDFVEKPVETKKRHKKEKKPKDNFVKNHNDDQDEQKSEGDESDENGEQQTEHWEEPKSSYELRQARLNQRIQDYEEEVLGEKPWQLKGEVQASSRPHNSLLEEVLEFESTVRAAPVITEGTTRCLEDIIKQRIRNQAWDDVVRIAKPVTTPQDYRKKLVLDQEKSKESLAHIYEKEYQKEMEKLSGNKDLNEVEEPKEHQEIRKLMRDLFIKLDALSNFHFTPKPVAPEPKIITNTPAVAMEEVAPIAVSDVKLLAPEEVFRGPKHELIGKSERTKTDKNRALRKKKTKQRAVHKALEAKDLERQKQGIPLSKKEESAKLMKKLTKQRNIEKTTSSNDQSALKSSKAFFSKLQDQATANVKPTKRKQNTQSLSAKKLKL